MLIEEFDFDLPHHLIAQAPLQKRDSSRLLVLNKNTKLFSDKKFVDFVDLLNTNDLLIFNDTRVIKARLFGKKITGGKVEIMIERILNNHHALAHLKTSKKIFDGTIFEVNEDVSVKVVRKENDLFYIEFDSNLSSYDILEKYGHIPLPPYIERSADKSDENRYQTIYAKESGAVAAPTAGLHFTDEIFKALNDKKIKYTFLTLHVGAGTFQPVRENDLDHHQMHSESFNVPDKTIQMIDDAKSKNGRIIAIGTTVLRALESKFSEETIQSGFKETSIFIKPGYTFKIVDALLTNFHLPKSTLFILVSAFSGSDTMKKLYQHAIKNEYRFFSYGDATFIERS
ncbi:MAG: S-adenosylmethionine:tRNA ribosyltransferase-isomerase [Pseudomonadota bacterium]|jgi:S-adenosylmethionine:tRNA ribosyltransferase-isomerase|uniref:tRNA preQ1(34) S-adenosylmethionine ribosyltransferase-isomerase QueA n=1 Tax=Candidatus Methylopumilus planktonicus TaxID=1581557 RepID=UPI00014DFB19|nr:tRNA preQ1(34) S-adenosylmethionine ribosyltransferase-isomerase QueA [Candidatus Methylopumilus planktonicus]MDH4407118.1 tRNA preQ1(34) S-adenosylmethionine ribosyltransferase-isomerase QueA [Candidatus Methylopumilus sp.]QDD10505.1 tRNA preQ1(34) S-adenosylmethionine ribosyltransferase-isomerase QueA [Candidatus Methylopumilus planktonicus]QDD22975.1 tRNA preQ1(34) S-adenosylmethionine ribosyltransferase-isomerase QueA [Candidatus Methylopumilus planktonicus]